MSESSPTTRWARIVTLSGARPRTRDGDRQRFHATFGTFVRQAGFGLIVGIVLGYLAALARSSTTRSPCLLEYARLTLMAVIGAFLSADGLDASGFTAVFVFGIMIGNKDAFGFSMALAKPRRFDEFVYSTTTCFILRLRPFSSCSAARSILLMIGPYLARRLPWSRYSCWPLVVRDFAFL